ncbi:MAG: cyclic nucleotide-binding domain-containing protein [Pseudomonadales bacterium]|nr:cyclic nucleotide-binding domain-containing protein [Pseudomonadales bacterium]
MTDQSLTSPSFTEMELNAALLKQYSPYKLMQKNSLEEAILKSTLVSLDKGKMLFKREDKRKLCHWLIEGKLDLVDENYETRSITHTDEAAAEMLEDQSAYQFTAVAIEDCLLITIDPNELDLIMTVDQVNEGSEEDWMTRLLQSRIFELIPPANIQTLFDKFESVNYNTNDIVITEGDIGDYFYVVKSGKLSIDRGKGNDLMHLAQIGPGSFFGEDALVRNAPRNATITMLSAGVLMRLGKEDFTSLLIKPATEYVTIDELKTVIESGEQTIRLIDVRHEEEYKSDAELNEHPDLIANALNITLSQLRDETSGLSHDIIYVVSTPARRGELGAFILNQAGFDTYLLRR